MIDGKVVLLCVYCSITPTYHSYYPCQTNDIHSKDNEEKLVDATIYTT